MEARRRISEILRMKAEGKYETQDKANAVNLDILNILEKPFPEGIKIEHDRAEHSVVINCYAYALRLDTSEKYTKHLGKRHNNGCSGINSKVISYFLNENYLEEMEKPLKGCLVLYFDEQGTPKHAEILQQEGDEDSQIVRSRWGSHKATLTHRLWYVPPEHGTKVRYYLPLKAESAENYFCEYLVGEKGIRYEDRFSFSSPI